MQDLPVKKNMIGVIGITSYIQYPPKVWRQPVIFLLPSITTPRPIKLKKNPKHFQTL